MKSKYFYRDLRGFTNFSDVTLGDNFSAVPGDWVIVIADVKGSTEAIEAGRYKDVNTIGAASIVSAHNALRNLPFPYAFGGDGAVLLIPSEYRGKVEEELGALRELSCTRYGLELRVGVVGMDRILRGGATLEVAKFLLAKDKSIAMFRGGGLSLAERLIKEAPDTWALRTSSAAKTDLRRLSCRWNPIPAHNGIALSLLVVGRGARRTSCYRRVLSGLQEIVGGRLENANPVNVPSMTYRSFGACFHDEKRLHRSVFEPAFLHRVLEILGAVLVFRFGVKPLIFNPGRYAASLPTYSDYRKFDDMLRMVIDCSEDQVRKIETLLDEGYRKGELYYGLHLSDSSLMTCFVDWLDEGHHIHFIDGGNGGYAIASRELKARMREKP
jgi:hypothetical protein